MTGYDIIVLGGGPSGYIAAERFSHAGRSVFLVEASLLGGIYLNVGCIPTKALLGVARTCDHARHGAQLGVRVGGAYVDWPALQKWKDKVVSTLIDGVAATEKKAGVTVVHDCDTSNGPGKVTVGGTTHTATHMILAAESMPVIPSIPGTRDSSLVIDSIGALSLPEIPEHLAMIGGGVIGMEFASLCSMLGTQVTIIEMLPKIVPFADDDVTAQLRKALKDVTFKLGYWVTSIDGGRVNWAIADGTEKSIEADYMLMAVGHRPAVDDWGVKNTGLEYSDHRMVVDGRIRTSLPNVWMVRDVTGRGLLARAVYRMGEVAAANILDPEAHRRGEMMHWHTIPWAVYTALKCASIRLTEATARKAGRDVIAASVPGYMSGRFVAEDGLQTPGLARLVLGAETRQVLGIHVLGSYAAEIIWGASAVLETELGLTGLHQLVFPHPTVSELIRKAAWAAKA